MLSVIIPTYCERDNIEPLLTRLDGVRAALGEPLEVLCMDSSSPDGTADMAARGLFQRALGRVISLPRHAGLAEAVMGGVREAAGDLIGVMDADLSHPPELLPALVRSVRSGHDVAVASRYRAGAGIVGWPWSRRFLSFLGSWLARPLVRIADATSGYFVCRTEIVKPLTIHPKGFKILLELLVIQDVRRAQEVPYVFTDRTRGASKLRGRVLSAYLSQLARLYEWRWRHRRRAKQPAPTRDMAAALPQTGRARLSVAVLTKNEERRITRCLESVRWADEIVVVDGLSTDRTVEICEAFGAKVISHPFSGDFGMERNIGNDAAQGDWILQLDADDAVSPELRAQIEQILREGSPYAAYKFRRKNWFLGHEMRHGGWYHYYPHLFRRGQAHFEGRVHHLLRTTGPMGTLEGALEHRPFDSLHQFVARHNRYTAIEAQEMLDEQGVLDPRLVRYHLTRRPLKLFWKTYVRKGGFREGWHGLIFSILFAWVHVLKWAKYWELSQAKAGPTIPAPSAPPGTAALAAGGARRRPTLSVVMMTKNEEARLASCLDRVVGWADEIVIIDDLSTDRTVEIARRCTDKVWAFPSEDNHDLQWNRGIERATSEWIFHIDADEVVTPQLKEAIDRALSDSHGHSAFEMMRKNFFLGHPMRFGGWYHRHLVLFRRDRARCVGKGIHVQLRVEGTIGFLDAELEHYPFHSVTQFIERQNHYTTVEAGLMVERQPTVVSATLAYQLTWRPIKLFWKSYRKNEGVREGWHGLVFGLLYAFVHTLRWAKYWERVAVRGAAAVQSEAETSVEECPVSA